MTDKRILTRYESVVPHGAYEFTCPCGFVGRTNRTNLKYCSSYCAEREHAKAQHERHRDRRLPKLRANSRKWRKRQRDKLVAK